MLFATTLVLIQSFLGTMGLFSLFLLVVSMETSQAWFGLNSKPSLPVSMPEKQAFLRALTEPIFDPKSTEICLDSLIASNPTPMPCSPSALAKFSQGKWQVCYAPHIRILEKVTLNTYDVYYEFIPTEDKMISYVRYDSPVFQKGWLNTSGRVESVSDNVCRVVWDKIWLDWNTLEQGPTKETQTDNHILPALVQAIGEKGFLESASRFPVLYLDSDLCVFQFQITGTKVCAKRV